MSDGFSLADVLADLGELDLGTEGREQIEYIDISRIDPDPNNFYALSGIEELAANIELIGLQQPLRVRTSPDNRQHVMIVSGHRRSEAIRILVNEGKEQFRLVPCLREPDGGSAALQELKLIYANSDTRRMTPADISKQAERVENLLYQLKEEGMEFPGRMRDHVAEACKVSKSKLARLKVIRDKLSPELKAKYFDSGEMSEDAAYNLARLPEQDQQLIVNTLLRNGTKVKYFYAHTVNDMAKDLDRFRAVKCGGGTCSHTAELLAKLYAPGYRVYNYCQRGSCCTCPDIGTCKSVCPNMAFEAKRAKDDLREKKRTEALAKQEKERPDIEQITKLWKRFGEARARLKLSVKDYHQGVKMMWAISDDARFRELETGKTKITLSTYLPYGYGCQITDVQKYIRAADTLHCSLDYLLCRTDEPLPVDDLIAEHEAQLHDTPGEPEPLTLSTGKPPASGWYAARFDCDGLIMKKLAWYESYLGKFYFDKSHGHSIEAECTGWIRLPDDF